VGGDTGVRQAIRRVAAVAPLVAQLQVKQASLQIHVCTLFSVSWKHNVNKYCHIISLATIDHHGYEVCSLT